MTDRPLGAADTEDHTDKRSSVSLSQRPESDNSQPHLADNPYRDPNFISRCKSPSEIRKNWVSPKTGSFGEMQGSLITICADTGAGKTQLMLALGLSIATNTDFLNIGLEALAKEAVVFFSAENPDDVENRLNAECYHRNISINSLDETFFFIGGVKEPLDILKELTRIRDRGYEPKAIFVDTLTAWLASSKDIGDFNVNGPAVKLMRDLRFGLEYFGKPTAYFAAHSVKTLDSLNDLVPLGGGTLVYEVDGNMGLWKENDAGLVSLQTVRKFRGKGIEKTFFQVSKKEFPEMTWDNGKPMWLPIIEPSEGATLSASPKTEANKIALLRCMIGQPRLPRAAIQALGERVLPEHGIKKGLKTYGNWVDDLRDAGMLDQHINEETKVKSYSLNEQSRDYLISTGQFTALTKDKPDE